METLSSATSTAIDSPVVGDEADAEEVADIRVVVDNLGDVDDETDYKLGDVVTRSSLACKDGGVLDKLLALLGRCLLDLEVAVNDTKDVERLALVLVETLDLASEDTVDIDLETELRVEDFSKLGVSSTDAGYLRESCSRA